MATAARTILPRLNNAATISGRLFSTSAAESEVYKRALKVQRPSTVKYREILRNSVSLIGTVERPLRGCKTSHGDLGVHTVLRVRASTGAHRHFWVLLKFWDEIAEMSVQHLKPDDLIFVSGHLGSYVRVDADGKCTRHYEVNVAEINFVAQHGIRPACQNSVKLEHEGIAEDFMQRHRARLHLWQIFFINPHEWWDNRNHKLYPSSPDFKHKDTGEKLWLHANDPPWIKKQLELHDSGLNKQNHGDRRNNRLYLSPLVYDGS